MKKILSLLIVISITFIRVDGTSFNDSLPGGKNYINEAIFVSTSGSIYTNATFLVKKNTNYTISVPGTYFFDKSFSISVEGNADMIFDDDLINPNCTLGVSRSYCTFNTGVSDYVSLAFYHSDLGMYYDYYAMHNFMLEEGNIMTTYEAYIPPLTDTTDPLISGEGAYIMSYEETTSLDQIISTHIVAYDEVDGDITDQIVVTMDTYSNNIGVVGSYTCKLSVSDEAGNSSNFILTIIVKDEILPNIIAPSELIIDSSLGVSINDIISEHVIYNDSYDTNPTLTIVTDEYSTNEQTLGSYDVLLEVTDSSNNKNSTSITLIVSDVVAPVLESSNTVTSYLSNPLTITEIFNDLVFYDTHDSVIDTSIITHNYNASTLGVYNLEVSAIDDSGNVLVETIEITVVDDINPVITAPDTITMSYEEMLSINAVNNLISVSDNYDSSVSLTYDSIYSNEVGVGEYLYNVEAVDQSGNKTTHVITLQVIDDVSPIIYIDDFIITVSNQATFKQEDLLSMLKGNDEISENGMIKEVLIDEYTSNEEVEGSYVYKVLIEDEGELFEKEFLIHVVDDQSSDNKIMIIFIMIVLTCLILYQRSKKTLNNLK